MFVSVVIPVYNDARRVEVLIKALVAQSYPRSAYEVVAVDNRSTDGTLGILKRWEHEQSDLVRVVSANAVQSSYSARNKGVNVSQGKILAFIDSDCIPEKDWIECGIAGLQEENVKYGGGQVRFFFESERPNICECFDAGRKLNQKAHIEKAGFAATANLFVQRELFDQYGLFRSDMISGGDYEFGRRLTKSGETIIYIPRAVVYHPARTTFGSILKKSIRVAEGQRQLEKEKLLEHGRITPCRLLPKVSFPMACDFKKYFSIADKLKLLGMYNFIRWLNFFIRIR